SAGQPLTAVVVRVTLEPQCDAGREEGAETLPRGAREGDVDGAVRQACTLGRLGDLVAKDRADRPVDVADLQRGTDGLAGLQCGPTDRDQLLVECYLDPVVLSGGVVQGRTLGQLRLVEDRLEIQTVRLPVRLRRRGLQHLR